MSDYKLAIKIAGELDSSLSNAVKEAQGYLDDLNGNGGGGAGVGKTILGGLATGAKTVAKASLETFGSTLLPFILTSATLYPSFGVIVIF